MDTKICLFCESEYGDPMQPSLVDKVAALCHLTSNKHQLIDRKMCMSHLSFPSASCPFFVRCKLDIDMIENAMRLRDIMVGTLNSKLTRAAVQSLSQSTPVSTPADTSSRNGTPTTPAVTQSTPNQSIPIPPDVLPVQKPVKPENGHVIDISKLNMPHMNGDHAIKSEPHLHPKMQRHHQINGGGFSYTLPTTLGLYNGVAPPPTRTNGRRIQSCHKCNISLKTRPYHDALKHLDRCNGQGIKPGRPALTPKPDMFPCHLCGRKLATREAHEVHIARCDGVNNNTRGRKPADNTCMLCDEDLVYRHILKKHLRQKHGINAQRLDDSVLAALKTGSGTGCDVKEQVLSRIQEKMLSDMREYYTSSTSPDNHEGGESNEDDTTPAEDRAANHAHGTRSRRKVKPSKYIPDEIYTCPTCNKQFEYESQYNQHCCFKISESRREDVEEDDEGNENEEPVRKLAREDLVESYTAMEVEEAAICE